MASIVERKKRFYVVYMYNDEKGARKQKWESFTTYADARRRKAEVEYREQMGSLVIPQCRTMHDLLQEYVSMYGKNKWALSTYQAILLLFVFLFHIRFIPRRQSGAIKIEIGLMCLCMLMFPWNFIHLVSLPKGDTNCIESFIEQPSSALQLIRTLNEKEFMQIAILRFQLTEGKGRRNPRKPCFVG